jgi:SAM-dependent methyltransferase
MNAVSGPARQCLRCGGAEPVAANDPVWPPGWQCAKCGHVVAEGDGIPMFAPELADTISGFDPESFLELSKIEAEHFWFVTRNELIVGLANKFFPDARKFLEVGCGNGAVLRAVAASRPWERLVGSELHPRGLAFARERLPQVEFVQMDARNIPATGLFDLTGAFDVIEHIEEDEAVLRGLRKATQAGGGTIIAVPQHPWLWSRADDVAHHQRRYRRGELEEKFRRNGFEVLFSSSFTALLLPLMAASRLKGRGKTDNDDIDREFTLSPGVNSLLIAVLRAEIRMTLAGLNWPAGGSRIVVGRAI